MQVGLELVVDGKVIPTNNMVKEMLANMVGGVADSLRGVDDDWNELEPHIKR